MIEMDSYSVTMSGNQRFRQKNYPFFWFVAAADERLLQRCAVQEQDRQAGIGMAVICTSIAAIISAGYAINSLFNNWFSSVLIGLFWGLIIFNLDRFMIGSMRKRRNKHITSELLVALPRIILAIFIAIVISKPLEVKIFENQIADAQIAEDKQSLQEKFEGDQEQINKATINTKEEQDNLNKATAALDPLNDQLYRSYKRQFEECIAEKNQLQERLNNAYANLKNYKDAENQVMVDAMLARIRNIRGRLNGLNCDKTKSDMQLREKEYIGNQTRIVNKAQMRAEAANKARDSLKNVMITQIPVAEKVIQRASGDILGKLNILDRIKKKNSSMWWASLLITFLFFILETAPVIVKICTPRGEYDTLVSLREQKAFDNEEAEEEESRHQKDARKVASQKTFSEAGVVDEMVKAQVQEKILEAQAFLAEKVVEAWKQEELASLDNDRAAYLKGKINPSDHI